MCRFIIWKCKTKAINIAKQKKSKTSEEKIKFIDKLIEKRKKKQEL